MLWALASSKAVELQCTEEDHDPPPFELKKSLNQCFTAKGFRCKEKFEALELSVQWQLS